MLSSAGDNDSPRPQSSDPPVVVAVPSSDPPPCDGTVQEPVEGDAPSSDPRPRHCSNFSIREYVFRSRSKDIYTNWPFSQKNLQLCLQRGVSEVLPRFQRIGDVNCHSFEIPKLENRSFVGKDRFANIQSIPSRSKSKVPSPDCAAELTVDGAAAASSEQLSLVRSPTKGNASFAAPHVSLASTEQFPAKTAIPPASFKSGSLAQAMGKKSRLIVKFGARSERSLGDDVMSNCTSVSENMGSKVCPVCKTFSSSSNTTLNAHIDQCLSLESTPKGVTVRHRIKPRKTRLMVDIYETAKRCTIEELNQRNGLTCANSLTKNTPTIDAASGEERRPDRLVVRAGDPSDAGAVYIDANGTKLRILSKFNDASVELGIAKDVQSRNTSQGNKGIGLFKKKTKKLHRQKRYKYLKLASKSKKLRSTRRHESQFLEQKNLRRMDEDGEGLKGPWPWSQGPFEPGVPVTLRRWSSSKRTGVKKKLASKGENPLRCRLHLAQGSPDENDQAYLVSRMPMRSRSFSLLGTSENSVYSLTFDSEKEKSWSNCRFVEREEPAECKRSLTWSDATTDSLEKCSFRKLQKDDHFQEVNHLKIRKPADESSVRQKKGVDIPVITGGGVSNHNELRPRSFSRKALRFSTLRKRALSLCQSSENSSDVSVGQREFFFKEPRRHSAGGTHHMIEDPFDGRSVEEDTDFKFSPGESYEMERTGLLEVTESSGISEKVHPTNSALNDTLDAKPSEDAAEDCTWGLKEYYDPASLNHSDGSWTDTCSQQFLRYSNESLCSIDDDFSRAYNGIEENANDKNDNSYGAGLSSSFMEIDPIPIPGPPGSFLPSPGALGSDDFQGNSSLTTSQAQSSHDNHQDLINGDLSDSPASAASTVSNSAEAKWGMDYSEELASISRPLLPESPWMGFSSAGCISTIQQSALAAPSSSGFPETIGSNSDDKNVFIKKGPPFSGDDDEPCCCQKIERAASQRSVLNYREIWPPNLRKQTGWNRVSVMDVGRPGVESEGLITEAVKSSRVPPSRGFASGELWNGSDHVDCDFPIPPGSNPVLRLMGKDLIVNKDGAELDICNSTALAPEIRGSVCLVGGPNQKEYHCYKDTDYPPALTFTGSASSYQGITMPVTVQPPKLVPKLPDNGLGSRTLSQFESMTVEQVGSSKQMMNTATPIYPKEAMVIDGSIGRNLAATSSAVNSGNLPRDADLLPQAPDDSSRGTSTVLSDIYQPREPSVPNEPVAELAGSHPRSMGFRNLTKTRRPVFFREHPLLQWHHSF